MIGKDACCQRPSREAWFGGKSRVAPLVWQRFGDVGHYIEPFFGSGAVLLGRPDFDVSSTALETINDRDGFVANFWRAVQADPEAVAHHADWPTNEADLHARHAWLVERRDVLLARLMGDPDYCDAQLAGWWVWGICCWIGGNFCSGDGPWQSVEVAPGDRQLVHLGNAGQGVRRQLVHLGGGRGVNRQLVHLGDAGAVAGTGGAGLVAWMAALSERLRRVRVCCGDWLRCCDSTATLHMAGTTGVFLDPPYSLDVRDKVYAEDSGTVAAEVRDWCLRWGGERRLRVALCGYEGEGHDLLLAAGWTATAWKTHGGYSNQGNGRGKANQRKERIWWSPGCLAARQQDMFDVP